MSNMNDFVIEDGVLIKYTGKGGNVVIPEGIAKIGKKAFFRKGKVNSVTVAEGTEEIGEQAFAGCRTLEWVKLPQSVKTICDEAFRDCPNLESVTAPDHVAVGSYVCRNSDQMADAEGFAVIGSTLCCYFGEGGAVVIPERVKHISASAFAYTKITSIVIPKGITAIDAFTFKGCGELTEVTLPEGLAEIKLCAFAYCGKLAKVVLPEGVTCVGIAAFSSCKELTEVIFPSTVASIEPQVFERCDNLKRITLLSNNCKVSPKILESGDQYWHKFVPIWCRDISALPAVLRPNAAVAFAEDEADSSDARFAGHTKYIKSNAAKLVDRAMEYPALLALMCREKLIAAKHVALYMDAVQKTENPELVAMVLDYQANKLTLKQKEQVEKQKDQQENTVLDRAVARMNQVGISGLNFVVTGDVNTFANRKELKTYIENQGGKLQSAMSAKTDYLIMNDGYSDTEKKRRALELGIEIISERQFNEKAGRLFEIDENGILTRYLGDGGDLIIPYGVRVIGESAFFHFSSLTSLTIPDSVVTIGNGAFHCCENLTSLTLGQGIETIGDFAFADCVKLTSVVIPYGVRTIGAHAFLDCHNLENVVIPDSVERILRNAFRGCPKIADSQGFFIHKGILSSYDGAGGNVTIPQGVTEIGDNVFQFCKTLSGVVIPAGVTKIGSEAFYCCGNLTTVTLGNDLRIIGGGAFSNCENIERVTIPEGVTTIGEQAFRYCSKLKAITIPGSVTVLGDSSFESCRNLTTVKIGSGVTAIGSYAFDSCYRLRSVYIPDSVTRIGENAFERSSAFQMHGNAGSYAERYASNKGIPFVTEIPGEKNICKAEDFVIRQGFLDRYRGLAADVVVPDGVTRIGMDAFRGCETIVSVTFPDSVAAMSDFAFRNCENLTDVRLGRGLAAISGGAFLDCNSLCSITIPGNVVTIGNSAFGRCRKLASVTIESGTTTIEPSAFRACGSLTAVTIPATVTTIKDFAFRDCPSLTIYGKAGSYAETYAKENNIPFAAE